MRDYNSIQTRRNSSSSQSHPYLLSHPSKTTPISNGHFFLISIPQPLITQKSGSPLSWADDLLPLQDLLVVQKGGSSSLLFSLNMFGSGMNLITTVIGFGLSITFILFICMRLICGRARDAEAQLEFGSELRSEPEQTLNGLEPVVVATFPTVKFCREAFPSREDAHCSICLGDYEEKEILRIMPTCCHNFHLTCIDEWLQKQSTCPVCRISLQDSFESKDMGSPIFSTMHQQSNTSEASRAPSFQWLLPNNETSLSGGNNRENHG